MKKCKFYAETARRGWCSNVDCLLEKCYFDDNFNSCELFDPIKCEKESSPSTLKYDKVETVKLMPDNGRSIDKRTLTIQNCDKIILKPKSLEVEIKIEKDNFDDYFKDQSEAEQIIDDATDKLIGLISEKTKSEIERYKNWYESSDKMKSDLQKQVYEQQEKIKVLEIDLKRAKEELERKDNEIPRVPFMPGDEIWWVGNDCRNEVVIKCSTCEGKGKVKTKTADYGEVEITCPSCRGNSVARYEPAKAYQGYVVRSHITLDAVDDVPSFIYNLVRDKSDLEKFKANEDRHTFSRYEIYKTKEEAEKAADQETKIRKLKAEEQLFGR